MDFFEDCFEDFCELVKTETPQNVQAAISGVDVNAESSLGMTALMCAAEYNPNPEVITVLLKAGADVNAQDKYGTTPLMFAAKNIWEHPEVITILLDAGADGKAKNDQGKTAFDEAQQNQNLKDTDAYRQLQEASQ